MKRTAAVLSLLLSLLLFLTPANPTYAASPDDSFNPTANSWVQAIALQPDGKILVAGSFTTIGGQAHNRIARINPDGSVDPTFNPDANGDVLTMAVQADGKIIVGGWFTTLNGITRNNIGRLNPDGRLDYSFDPGANDDVFAVAVQSDGKIIVAGFFSNLGGAARSRIGRLNADGSLDSAFNPGADSMIFKVAVQPDGKILVGGLFTTLGGEPHNFIGRLTVNGIPDTSFTADSGGPVNDLAIQADGRIVVVGTFDIFNGAVRKNISRVNYDGSLDASLDIEANNQLSAVAIQEDGKILVGGHFTTLNGQPYSRIGRINLDGSLDTSFNPGASGQVMALAVQTDGKILVGGGFSTLGGQERISIGRLYPDGSVETPFNPGANGLVYALAVQPDGKILVGGEFTLLDGQARSNIGRLNANGSLDTGFNSDANDEVFALAVQGDGKILVGGAFTILAGQPRRGIGRLNADGSFDTGFTAATDGVVSVLSVQADGKILVGGSFATLNGQPRSNLGRLNADGTLDTTFNPGASIEVGISGVIALASQSDGKIVVGGMFTRLSGQNRENIGRLNADGSLDTTFNPGASYQVFNLVLQPDGKILVAGTFSRLGGQDRNNIGRLNPNGSLDTAFDPGAEGSVTSLALQTDGKILVGGVFSQIDGQARSSIARLNPDGSMDLTFDPGYTGSVEALGLQADGKVLLGGYFPTVGEHSRSHIARLSADSAALQSLHVDPQGAFITWKRSGSGPEFDRVTFELSIDHGDYALLGHGRRVTGGWDITALDLPKRQNLSIRARGYYASGFSNGSYSVVEAVQVFSLDEPLIGPIFTVNTTADHDDGVCSTSDCTLREAIIAANMRPSPSEPDEIHFNISTGCDGTTGVCTIRTNTQLPDIRDAVIIDGYTQPGASANTLAVGSNVRLLIELNGENAPRNANGLLISRTDQSIVRGLVINRFKGYGIYLRYHTSQTNYIRGNFIGSDASGTHALGNERGGIFVLDGSNIIGGANPGDRNLISGNNGEGIEIQGNRTQVLGNYIGTNATGTASLGNQSNGIDLSRANNTIIGGTAPGSGNIVSGNSNRGISIYDSPGTTIQGNFIGTNSAITTYLGNGYYGVEVISGNVRIGGTTTGAGNVIAGNGLDGVLLYSSYGTAAGNAVQGNAIYDNAGLGININPDGTTHNDAGDVDTGTNNLQNFPVLTSLNGGVLSGTLNSAPGTTFRVEFFASVACDPSGYGEGQQLLGAQNVTTDASGNAAITFAYTPASGKPYVTATATNTITSDSSEFSPCLPYAGTTTTISVSPEDAATYGDSLHLTTVVTTGIIDNPFPTGKVQFKDGSSSLGVPVTLDASGTASLTISSLSAGQHTLSAEFLANEAYPGSTGSQPFRVNPKNVTVSGIVANDKVYDGSTSASLNTSGAVLAGVVNGDSVQLNSTGVQAVFADKNTGNSKPVTVTGLTLSGSKAGTYTLAMPALTASITPRQLTVTAENKRKVYGESIPSLTAAYSGFAPGETSSVLTRLPELTTTATRTSPVGAYPITITPGSPAAQNYIFTLINGTLTVEKASTSLQLSASPNDASYGEPITLTAVVTATAPGYGVPGGTVTFSDGDIILGSAVLNINASEGAVATFTTSALAAGPHEITATFSGNGNFTGSAGSTAIIVTPTAELSISILTSTNPVLAGSPLTLTFNAENHGLGTAESTVLHIALPEGLNFQSVTSMDGVTCNREDTYLTCQIGDMADSSIQTVTVELFVPRDASGTYSTSADLDSSSIYLPGGGRPAAETIITVLPRSFVFLPQVTR